MSSRVAGDNILIVMTGIILKHDIIVDILTGNGQLIYLGIVGSVIFVLCLLGSVNCLGKEVKAFVEIAVDIRCINGINSVLALEAYIGKTCGG